MEKVLNATLCTVANGAAEEFYQQAMKTIGLNLIDPNTDPEQKRTFTLTFEVKMDKRRSDLTVKVKPSIVLASQVPAVTHFQLQSDARRGVVMHEPELLPFEDDAVRN